MPGHDHAISFGIYSHNLLPRIVRAITFGIIIGVNNYSRDLGDRPFEVTRVNHVRGTPIGRIW